MVTVGKVLKTRGNKGEVAVKSFSDNSGRFETFPSVFTISGEDGSVKATLEKGWFHNGLWILKFEEYDDISSSEELVGGLIQIDDSELAGNGDKYFFFHDLVSMTVRSQSGCEMGRVKGVVDSFGSILLEVEYNGSEYYIPFVSEYVTSVEIESSTVFTSDISELIALNEN